MLEFGDLFDSNHNTVPGPIHPLLKETFDSSAFKNLLDSFTDPLTADCSRTYEYLNTYPNSLDLEDDFITFFNEKSKILNLDTIPLRLVALQRLDCNDYDSKKLLNTLPPQMFSICEFIENLCFLGNSFNYSRSSFDVLQSLQEDILNALIFNLKYPISNDSVSDSDFSKGINSLYVLYCNSKSIGDNICQAIIPKSILKTDFCKYSLSVLFSYDATHPLTDQSESWHRSFFSAYSTLHNENSKGRTFRKMLDNLGSLDPISPKVEDQWYLEKLFGFNTVIELYPLIVKNTFSRDEALDLAKELLKALLKCKPLRIRIYLARVISNAATNFQWLFHNNDIRSNNIYSKDYQEVLLYPLRKTIDFVNQIYFTCLQSLYNAVKTGYISPSYILSTLPVRSVDKFLPCISCSKSLDLSPKDIRGLKTLFCVEDVSSFIFNYFPSREAKTKTLRGEASNFSMLQTIAIKEILKNYNIPFRS